MAKVKYLFVFFVLFTEYISAQPIEIDLKIFLEGPYSSGSMSTSINSQLPLSQPFNGSPWNYGGTESVSSIPSGVVDWVLVELRDQNDATQIDATKAGLLLSDGHIVDVDGSSPLSFDAENKNYLATVKSRNHLGILSSAIVYNSNCPGIASVVFSGKTYNTVQIGNQCWLRENLDVGNRINGNVTMTDNGTIEKYCFDDNTSNCDTYGGLYQWNEAMQYVTTEGARGLCPSGWHIPTNAEFQDLSTTVSDDGDKLKAIGQGSGDGAGTNTSGFTALLAGYRSLSGSFVSNYADFWTSTVLINGNAREMYLENGTSVVSANSIRNQNIGLSVRCIKD